MSNPQPAQPKTTTSSQQTTDREYRFGQGKTPFLIDTEFVNDSNIINSMTILNNSNGTGQANCLEACYRTKNCTQVAYRAQSGVCKLGNSNATIIKTGDPAGNWSTQQLIGLPRTELSNDANILNAQVLNINTSNLQTIVQANSICSNLCVSNPNCENYAFNVNNGVCKLGNYKSSGVVSNDPAWRTFNRRLPLNAGLDSQGNYNESQSLSLRQLGMSIVRIHQDMPQPVINQAKMVIDQPNMPQPVINQAKMVIDQPKMPQPFRGPPSLTVVLFSQQNFLGGNYTISIGNYDIDFLNQTIGNDQLNSIFIPSGLKVTLYTENGFTGSSIDLYNSKLNLSVIGSTNFSNTVSSIKVAAVKPEEIVSALATVNADVTYLTTSNIGFENETFNDRYATQQSLLNQLPAMVNASSFAPRNAQVNESDLFNQVMNAEKPSDLTEDLKTVLAWDINLLRSRLDKVNNEILNLFNQGYVWQNAQPNNKYLYPLRRILLSKFQMEINRTNFHGIINSPDGFEIANVPRTINKFENVRGEHKSYYTQDILFLLLQLITIAILVYYLYSNKSKVIA